MKLQWEKTGSNEWKAAEKDEPGARITELTNGKNGSRFLAYRDGAYLGCDDSLVEAQSRAEKFEVSATRLEEVFGLFPAFVLLTPEERKASWRKYSNQPRSEVIMRKYEEMGLTELTTAYNKIVEECGRRQMGDLAQPIARFNDEGAARKAVLDLEASVRARIAADLAKLPASSTGGKDDRANKGPKVNRAASPAKAAAAGATAPAKALKPDNQLGKGKAKAKGKAEPAKSESVLSTSPPVKKAASAMEGFIAQIGAREGTNKEKLATCLFKNFGKDVKLSEVCKHVYGKSSVVPAIGAVINGLSATIKAKKLPYEIKRKEDSIGLYATSKAG